MPYVFDKEMGRRKFIKTTCGVAAAVGAGVGLAGCGPTLGSKEHTLVVNNKAVGEWGREAGEWIPSCCNMCGGQCGIFVHVVNGVVQKIEPNDWNPNNYSNTSDDFFDGYTTEYGTREGTAICPKGNAGIMMLYDPERIKTPMRRTNPEKGIGVDPKWKEISWDEAVNEIAGRMKELRDKGEAHRLIWVSEDHSFTHPQGDFMKLYGSPNYYMHSNLCDTTRKASFKMVMGVERPLCDFNSTKYMLLFGWNPTSALKWIHLGRQIPRAVENGAKLVVVDPYLSDTAAKAHEWISIRPGTDGAMALAMAHVIIRDNLYDADFVSKWTHGFDEYKAYVEDKTPEWAEQITSVPARTIERIAQEVAMTKPALIDAWSGPGQHTNSVQGGRAITALNALLGSYEAPGGMLIPNKKGNKHGHVDPEETVKKTLKMDYYDGHDKLPLKHKSGNYVELFRRMATGEGPYEPGLLMIVFQNPMMAVPGTKVIEEAFKKSPFTVVVDTMESETAQMADILLPGTTYLERYDFNTHWVTWPALGLRQPVVKPLFGQPTEYEFVAMLGRKLDLRDEHGDQFFLKGPESKQPIEDLTKWYEDYLSHEVVKGAPKMTLEELKALPGATWVDKKGTEYHKYAKPLKPEALAKAVTEDGIPYSSSLPEGTGLFDKPKGKRIGMVMRDPETGEIKALRAFDTPSGKCEFYQAKWAKKKDFRGNPVDPYPSYNPRDVQPSEEYPLYLINWKDAKHTHSRTWNNPWLRELAPDAPLMIHPETAARYGIGEGDEVMLESPQGAIYMKAHLTKRMHPEVIGAQHGSGHWAMGTAAASNTNGGKRHSHPGFLNEARFDPLAGQSCHKEICVRIKKV